MKKKFSLFLIISLLLTSCVSIEVSKDKPEQGIIQITLETSAPTQRSTLDPYKLMTALHKKFFSNTPSPIEILPPTSLESPSPTWTSQSLIGETQVPTRPFTPIPTYTFLVPPSFTPSLKPSSTPIPTNTPPVLPSFTPSDTSAPDLDGGDCELVSQEPKDGSFKTKNSSFDVHWVIKNTSKDIWRADSVDIRFNSGEHMHTGADLRDLPYDVGVDGMLEVVIPMIAPNTSGSYVSKWRVVSGSKPLCYFFIKLLVP